MTSPFRRNVELSGAAFRRRVSERFTEPNGLRAAMGRAQARSISRALETDGFGRAETGRELLADRFHFAGVDVKSGVRALWRVEPPSRAWMEAAHSFEWLDHLAAVGDRRARDCAIGGVASWLDRHESYDPIIWSIDVSSRRLRSWVLHAELIEPETGSEAASMIESIERSVWAHADWLMRRVASLDHGVERLRAAIAIATAGLSMEDWRTRRATISSVVDEAIEGAVLDDGGVISRSPEDAFAFCAQLRLLAEHYAAVDEPAPTRLPHAIEALAGAVRFFRMPDGGLTLFHGGHALADGRVDSTLTLARVKTEPLVSLPESGFQRMACGRVTVIMDVGAAPEGAAAETAHGSTLAIEMAAGRRRLVVNCGSGAHIDDSWRRACRGPAAHSTLVLDGQPFARPVLARGAIDGQEDRSLVGPPRVAFDRKEELNGVWVLGAHDGYLESHGVTVTRRLFLSADGGDFRGEDKLSVEDEDMRKFERAIAKLPRGQRDQGVPFVARFHLHPDVAAAIVADGEATTLRLPHGEVWVMRQVGGALALDQSIYFDSDGQPRQSKQIVVTSAAKDPGAQIRWAFRRVGELTQLPKDIEALLPPTKMPQASEPGAPRTTIEE